MPFTDHRTVPLGEKQIPVYWCSFGCKKGHSDPIRIEEHEVSVAGQPAYDVIPSKSKASYRYRCRACHLEADQPFVVAVHQCPYVAFKCPKQKPILREEWEGKAKKGYTRQRTTSGGSNASSSSSAS